MAEQELAIYQDRIRKMWHEGDWWFSVVDVIAALTESGNPARYWTDMKRRLAVDEGFAEVYAKCVQLKMRSPDGKSYKTDAANTETLLRIVQSIPSPKAEPFKQWLAAVGTERVQEDVEPPTVAELRLAARYRQLGYTDEWITRRMEKLRTRNTIVIEWGARGAVEGRQFARLTDTLSRGTFDITTREHRQIKQITGKHNLQDSMTPVELALASLADVTATELHRTRDSEGFGQLQQDCADGGKIAGDARRNIEELTGKPVVSSTNYQQLQKERQAELQPPLFSEE